MRLIKKLYNIKTIIKNLTKMKRLVIFVVKDLRAKNNFLRTV